MVLWLKGLVLRVRKSFSTLWRSEVYSLKLLAAAGGAFSIREKVKAVAFSADFDDSRGVSRVSLAIQKY